MERKIGPVEIVERRSVCLGCPALETKYWEDYLDDDEKDSGMSATCTAIPGGRSITAYWHGKDTVPNWCPVLLASLKTKI